jgi:hypothetical protein
MFKIKNHEVTKMFNPFYVLKAFLKKLKFFYYFTLN